MIKILSSTKNINRFLLSSCVALLSSVASAAVYQAEDYTYSYDTTPGNTGGVYRTNDVDIEAASDTGGGYNVGWIAANEWLSFSNVVIASSGNYKIRLRIASPAAGGVATVDLNGGTIILGNANIPATGGWQTWQTVEFTTNITAGTYSLGVFAKVAGWNFNWIEIVKNDPVNPTGVVTGYQHCSYGGWASALDVGSYNQAALATKGFVNNDASSIKVTAGYEAVLYKDDNFAGESTVISADETCLVDKNFNDQVSSVIVRKATTPTSNFISDKRGLAYGYHSVNDLKALQKGVRWWYNWAETPDTAVANSYQDYGFDYVPMARTKDFDETRMRNFLKTHPNVKYILGFNEPNFVEQANLTPAQAAAQWPRIEAIARDFNLKIVAPAVNYSPGQVDIPGTNDDSSPFAYLDAFFAACPNCKVDYIAIHSYMKLASSVESYVKEFERYGKPIWVTEWASWDDGGPANVNEQMDYLAETTRWFENNTKVFRYSWFIGRGSGAAVFPYIDILAGDGQLTPLGGLYTSIPSPDYYYKIPARIEAEGAHQNFGFKHERTSDSTGGNVNLCWTNAGDALEYKISVPSSVNYKFNFRLATAQNNRKFNVMLDGQVLFTQSLNSTGGWQNWTTFTNSATLPAGNHTLRIEALTDDINFNWFEVLAN